MDYLAHIAHALVSVLSWPNIVYPVIGTLAVMVTSFLPGIGGSTVKALALTLTLSWGAEPTMLLFGALVGGATFMGSVTAILFNVPGTAQSAAVLLDGYPMARRGEARTALACAAMASALGSTVGVVVLMAMLPLVRPLILAFGPLEMLLLALWGLTTIVVVSKAAPLKGGIMAGLGFALAMIGLDPSTAQPRWTLGTDYLLDGLPAIPVLLGLFAVAEAMQLLLHGQTLGRDAAARAGGGSLLAGCLAPLRHPGLFLRSSLIGTLIGAIPGIGGTVASFVAYGHAVQTAGDRSRFGQGDIRGVIAPEAAVDAKDGGSLLPVLAFGLPGSEGTVFLLAAMMIHGITPGRPLLDQHQDLVWLLIWALFLSNWLTSIVGLAIAGWLARLQGLRTDVLAPVVVALAAVGAVASEGQAEDLLVALLFGVFGYVLLRQGWPRVPLVIAFVLGRLVEQNLVTSLRLVELGRLDPLERPQALAIAALIVVTLVWTLRDRRRAAPTQVAPS